MISMKLLIILCATICVAFCAIQRVKPELGKSKTKEGFCEYKGEFIKQGESIMKSNCQKFDCNMDYSIILQG